MKNKLIASLFFKLFFVIMNAQAGGIISGKVTDQSGKFALPGAKLVLSDDSRYTISDDNGYFEFLNVPEGSYQLIVTYLGYKNWNKQITVQSGKNEEFFIELSDDTSELGKVVILGDQLKGQAKALNQQKNNSNISNVISSDQVGRFPDSNIGDALKRVPGITMQNDQGEARNIIIRGLAPELNSVTLNGGRIPSAEGDNRNVQMDLIPADMISTIEVNKTLTPDMDADAIGGSVDLVTRAVPNKQRISLTLSGGYMPIREKSTHSASLIYGNRFFSNKLGVVVSGSYQQKNYGSDNIESTWSKANNSQEYVSQFDIRKYDVERVRRSFSSSLDYKFNNNNRISADIMYNWRDDRENRYRTRYRSIKPQYNADGTIKGFTGDIRRETKGGINNDRNKNTRLEDQRIQNYAIKGQHLISDKLDLDWGISYSKASEERPNERYIDFQQKGVTIDEDLTDSHYPYISSVDENMDKMKFRTLTENRNYTSEEEYSAKINIRVPLSIVSGQKGRLRVGMKGRFKDKERNNIFYTYTPINAMENLSGISTHFWDGNNFNPGSKYVPGMFASKEYLGNLQLYDPALYSSALKPDEYLSKNYKAKEQIIAGYLRYDQNITDKLLFIIGVRAENTHIDYTGNYVISGDLDAQKVKKDNSYLNILPSVNMKYEVNKKFVLRSAFTTALARPNYYDLVPYTNISSSDMSISVGNPDLKATYSYNFDFMGEYYFKSVGIISAGFFYKNLKDFIYKYRNINYTSDNFSNDYPGVTNPVPTDESWVYTQSRNGKSVDVYGVEISVQRKLDFLPTEFLRNFNVYLNYTYTHSQAKGITNSDGIERKDMQLPGSAPHMVNASLSWENKRFSARVSLNYTSDYLDVLGSDDFNDSYYDQQMFVDANATFKVTPKFRIFIEANNLTNQPLRYYQGIKSRVQQLEYYKASYNFGVKYDF
ncbi:TonB-dependent receptor [Apibacter sp. HY039]|uniref:TonB-dependent receptor n=1 Tax=Apibacter sp. HY039 TaxID=2501476 RepID=UPI000FEBD0CF|nr:TonB-dependent receptor [Apibacter sp. HY039]